MNDQPPVDILENLRELFALITASLLNIVPAILVAFVSVFLLILAFLFFFFSGTIPSFN